LSAEAVITSRDVRICLHAGLDEPETGRALIGHNRGSQRAQAFALSAAHFALRVEYVERLGRIIAEEARHDGDVAHTFRSVAARTLCAQLATPFLLIQVAKLVAVVATTLFICALGAAVGALGEFAIGEVLPVGDFLASDTEVGVGVGQLPGVAPLRLSSLSFHLGHTLRKDYLQPAILTFHLTLLDEEILAITTRTFLGLRHQRTCRA